jgi:hypothetical protein
VIEELVFLALLVSGAFKADSSIQSATSSNVIGFVIAIALVWAKLSQYFLLVENSQI